MRVGSIIAERFRLLGLVGSGPMSLVYRAEDLHRGGVVAIKVLPHMSRVHAERFLREGEALAKFRHPAIVRYVAHGVDGDTFYVAMQWLEGQPLSSRLRTGTLELDEAMTLMTRLSGALAAIHTQGLVHRDVKPSNIMLEQERVDQATILDFGVARSASDGRALTASGVLVGSPGYLAPEQARSARHVDARADVFAAGCVLFRCLTGRLPFAGDTIHTTLAQTLFAPIPLPSEHRQGLPSGVDELVLRMLAKNPADRIVDGAALEAAVNDLVERLRGDAPSASGIRVQGIERGEHRLVAVIQVGAVWAEETAPGVEAVEIRKSRADDTSVAGLAARFGGACELLITGEAVITFSGDRAATDLARRAARCAEAIHRHAPDTPIALVMGSLELPTGAASLHGDVFHRAEELVQSAPCSGVRVDETIASLVGGRFLVRRDDHGAWLEEERAGFEEAGLLLGKRSPLVGRDPELALLRTMFDQCASTRASRVVLVTGEPGMGKSRLRKELVARLPIQQGIVAWIGTSDPLGGGTPLGPIARALRSQVGLFGCEPATAARGRLRAWLTALLPQRDVDRAALFIGELFGIPAAVPVEHELSAAREDPRTMGEQIRRAVRDVVRAVCQRSPLIIVLEDLHAADQPTIDLVDGLLDNLRDQRLMVLALARPEVLERFPRLWHRRGLCQVHLTAIAPEAARSLVDAVVDEHVPEVRRTSLVARAHGNPFFLEELIRRADDDSVTVPRSLVAMTQARLEGLPDEVRRTLRAAALFGEAFRAADVSAVLPEVPADDIHAQLHTLVELEIMEERPEPSFTGNTELGFRHALLYEAAYAMLTESDRERGHRAAAAWLSSQGEPNALVVAEHWRRAGCGKQAGDAFATAARQARDAGALRLAVEHAERGLAGCEDAATSGELLAIVAEMFMWLGELNHARDAAARALESLPSGDRDWIATAGIRAEALARLGAIEGGMQALEELVFASVPESLESSRSARAYTALGALLTTSAAPVERMATCREALESASERCEFDAPALVARCRTLAWWGLLVSENPEEYLCWSAEAVRQADGAGDRRRGAEARHDVGFAFIMVGDHESAARVLRDGAELADELGLARAAATCRHNLGLALARLGRLDEAYDEETRALEAFEAQGSERFVTGCLVYLSEVFRLRGELEHAGRAAEEATKRVPAASDLGALALAQHARVQLDRGRVGEARETVTTLMEAISSLGPLQEEGEQIQLVRAETLLALGEHETGLAVLREARERIEAKASRIRDPEIRSRYLERVPANARVLELAGR